MKLADPGSRTNLVLFALNYVARGLRRGRIGTLSLHEYVEDASREDIEALCARLANVAGTPRDPFDGDAPIMIVPTLHDDVATYALGVDAPIVIETKADPDPERAQTVMTVMLCEPRRDQAIAAAMRASLKKLHEYDGNWYWYVGSHDDVNLAARAWVAEAKTRFPQLRIVEVISS